MARSSGYHELKFREDAKTVKGKFAVISKYPGGTIGRSEKPLTYLEAWEELHPIHPIYDQWTPVLKIVAWRDRNK